MAIRWIGSCNKTTGRGSHKPEAVVIHIMDDFFSTVDGWFNTPASATNTLPVSAHYGVGRDGTVHQYVQENDTAWHAGRVFQPTWTSLKPVVNPNLYTIGIEHEGHPNMPWTDAMYEATAALIAAASQRWSFPIDRDHVVGHCEIYAKKSFCPGPNLDFDELIAHAQSVVLSGVDTNLVTASGTVTVQSGLNVRLGAPTSTAEIVTTVSSGTALLYVGWTSNGEAVHGNAHWYVDAAGNYFWAGATDQPVPATG